MKAVVDDSLHQLLMTRRGVAYKDAIAPIDRKKCRNACTKSRGAIDPMFWLGVPLSENAVWIGIRQAYNASVIIQ